MAEEIRRETKADQILSSLTVSDMNKEVGQKTKPYLPNLPVLLFCSFCEYQQRVKARFVLH